MSGKYLLLAWWPVFHRHLPISRLLHLGLLTSVPYRQSRAGLLPKTESLTWKGKVRHGTERSKSRSLPQPCLRGLRGLAPAHLSCQAPCSRHSRLSRSLHVPCSPCCRPFSHTVPSTRASFPLLPNLLYLGSSTGPSGSYLVHQSSPCQIRTQLDSLPQAPRGNWLTPADTLTLCCLPNYTFLSPGRFLTFGAMLSTSFAFHTLSSIVLSV